MWLHWFNRYVEFVNTLVYFTLIAYVATKWLFCMYHSAVVNFRFKHEGTPNYFSRFWWYLFVVHFERNVPAGKLPVSYLCPKRFYHTYLSNFIKAKWQKHSHKTTISDCRFSFLGVMVTGSICCEQLLYIARRYQTHGTVKWDVV